MGTWHRFGGAVGIFERGAAALVAIGLLASSIAYTAAPNAPSKAKRNAAAGTPAAKAAGTASAKAQAPVAAPSQFKSLPVDESQSKRRVDINRILRAQAFQPGEDKLFETYYLTYAFPRWTQPGNLSSIAKEFRGELRRDLQAGRSGAPYDRLVNLTLNFMTPMVNDRGFHPAVRYNAMAAIAELDVFIPPAGTRRVGPPLPAALDLMLAVLQDPAQIDAVRIAALQGLVRHASAGIADAQKRDQQVLPLLLQWASTKDPPAGRTKVGHAWMRALAIEALGALGLPGANGQVVKTLTGVLTESDTPLMTRLAAAHALGQIQYKGLTAVKPADVVVPLTQFMLDAITAEARRPLVLAAGAASGGGMPGMYPGTPGMTPTPMPNMSPEMMPGYPGVPKKGGKKSQTPSGMYSGETPMMPGMYPGMPGMGPGVVQEQADERAVIFRRRLKTVLRAVQSALGREKDATGLKSWVVDTADASLVALVDKYVNEQIRDLDDEESPVDSLKKKMAEHRKTLKNFLDDPAKAVAAYEAELQAKATRKK